jgi:hypothetical protein
LDAYNRDAASMPGFRPAEWIIMQNRRNLTGNDLPELLASATFAPTMPGDSKTARRLFSAILAGSIPVRLRRPKQCDPLNGLQVIICDSCILPYSTFLDWSTFTVRVPERRLLQDPSFNLGMFLRAIPDWKVLDLQQNLKAVRRHFMWPKPGERCVPGDAMDMMVCLSLPPASQLSQLAQVREIALGAIKARSVRATVQAMRDYGEWDPLA